MKRHFNYLKYILRHKYYVFIAAWKLKVSLWYAIFHDISKFLPSEWQPYAETFYGIDGSKQYKETILFNYAWNSHQKRNKHHWQYWILKMDRGELKILDMPEKYIREMVADWMGAGKAITGKWEVREWYLKNKNKIILTEHTRCRVESLLAEVTI